MLSRGRQNVCRHLWHTPKFLENIVDSENLACSAAAPTKTARVSSKFSQTMLFFLLLMLLFRRVCHQVSNQADKLDLLAIFHC